MKIIILFLICILFLGCVGPVYKNVCLRDICIRAEIADSSLKRQQGLMFKRKIADDQGMLFVFSQEDRYVFWMKNMRFPLDIIWISQDKRIVDINTEAQPCSDTCESMFPQEKAKYVLEVNSGLVDKHKIKTGDEVRFD